LEIKPDEGQPRLWLADTMLQLRLFDQAEEQYRTYLEEQSPTVDALWGLAQCQYQLGQHEDAAATLKKVTDKDPNHVPALLVRAKLIQAQRPREALSYLRQAVKLRPNMRDVLHNLVIALHQIAGQEKGAEAEAQMYQRRFDESEALLKQIAQLRMKLLKEADNLDLRCDIGKLYLQLDEEEAAHWFQSILYMDPNHRPTCQVLADYWEKHGNPSKAAHFRRKAGAEPVGKAAPPNTKPVPSPARSH
jgi:tetratricopeptide (TPR) repeat protein